MDHLLRFAVLLMFAALIGCGQDARGVVLSESVGDPARGKQAMRTYGCGSCHVIPGIPGAEGTVGAPLTDFARRGFIAGSLPNTPENLIAWLRNPQEIEPGTVMPNLNVTDADARDMAAYLATLR
jgi:cytochrome c